MLLEATQPATRLDGRYEQVETREVMLATERTVRDLRVEQSREVRVLFDHDGHQVIHDDELKNDLAPQEFRSLSHLIACMKRTGCHGTIIIETMVELEAILALPSNTISGLKIKTHNPDVKARLRTNVRTHEGKRVQVADVLRTGGTLEVHNAITTGPTVEPTFQDSAGLNKRHITHQFSEKITLIRTRLRSGQVARVSLPGPILFHQPDIALLLHDKLEFPQLLIFTEESLRHITAAIREKYGPGASSLLCKAMAGESLNAEQKVRMHKRITDLSKGNYEIDPIDDVELEKLPIDQHSISESQIFTREQGAANDYFPSAASASKLPVHKVDQRILENDRATTPQRVQTHSVEPPARQNLWARTKRLFSSFRNAI